MLKVKANQKSLFGRMQSVCGGRPLEEHSCSERRRGRLENRRVEVFDAPGELQGSWDGLATFLKVTRWGRREGREYERVGYYISDLRLGAEDFAGGIRRHWSVENSLHWIKDTVFGEDSCRARAGNGPAVLSMIRAYAIGVLAKEGGSITQTIRMVTNKPDKIIKLLE